MNELPNEKKFRHQAKQLFYYFLYFVKLQIIPEPSKYSCPYDEWYRSFAWVQELLIPNNQYHHTLPPMHHHVVLPTSKHKKLSDVGSRHKVKVDEEEVVEKYSR